MGTISLRRTISLTNEMKSIRDLERQLEHLSFNKVNQFPK
jgi:hypothetical protein